MQLKEEHINFIENSLKLYGIKSPELKEDLVDHISTYIENQDSNDFNLLYQEALQKFGGYTSFQNLQLETNLQRFGKERRVINRLIIATGFVVLFLLVIGSLFKIMHWPFASALLIIAIILFAFGILPLTFYAKYKKSIHKFS